MKLTVSYHVEQRPREDGEASFVLVKTVTGARFNNVADVGALIGEEEATLFQSFLDTACEALGTTSE